MFVCPLPDCNVRRRNKEGLFGRLWTEPHGAGRLFKSKKDLHCRFFGELPSVCITVRNRDYVAPILMKEGVMLPVHGPQLKPEPHIDVRDKFTMRGRVRELLAVLRHISK